MNEPNIKKQCWECKGRRLVCDYTCPRCKKCEIRGVDCPGYGGAKPLKWLQPQQVRSKGRRRDVRADSGSATTMDCVVVPRSIKPDRDSTDILEAFEYYNVHICPDLVATGIGGRQSPYFMPHVAVSVLPPSFTHSIVCTALCHRILQSSNAAPSDQMVLTRKLQKHRGEAVHALRADLAKPESHASDWTLACVLLLLLAEIQHSFSPNWRHHCDAAITIIEMMGGLGDLVFSRPYLRHLFRYYSIIEVMSSTTSPTIPVESARNQLELLALLPVLYGNGLDTCFPCPPDLFAEIIRINHLRSRTNSASAISSGKELSLLQAGKCSAALDILRRIRAFSPDTWAADAVFSIANAKSKSITAQQDATAAATSPDFLGWQSLALIYQAAVGIYCIASLSPNDITPETDTATAFINNREIFIQARQTCRTLLLTHLHNIVTTPSTKQCIKQSTQLRKLLLWPLVVAGIEAQNDPATQQFVADELKWISVALGTASPLVAREVLERRVWGPGRVRTRIGMAMGSGAGRWEELWERRYVFVV